MIADVQSCPSLCDPMDCSRPGATVLHYLPELAQTQVHWVSGTIQPSHPLLPPSPPVLNLSQHQSLFQWVNSSHQRAKVLNLQLQHQSFQWIFRADFLQDWQVWSLVLIIFWGLHPHDLIISPQFCLILTSYWGLRFQNLNFGRTHSVHSS